VDHRFEPVAARLAGSGCAGRPVITADRNWAAVDVGVTVRLIRP
jgi:PIN domain nuclease of toxin-antitoxin system